MPTKYNTAKNRSLRDFLIYIIIDIPLPNG